MTPKYYEINEETAKRSRNLASFRGYVPGSATAGYRSMVDSAYTLADQVHQKRGKKYSDRAYSLADRYSRKLAEYFNKENRIGCMCPSIMIAGGSGFDNAKKDKQNKAADNNRNFYEYVDSLKDKISHLLYCREIINSADEDAIEKLQEKVATLSDNQELMKSVNAYYRKNKKLEGCPLLSPSDIIKIKKDMCFHYEDKPYPSFALSNNRQNLKSTRDRLERLIKIKEKGDSEETNEFCTVVENTEAMRLQLFFDEKPEEWIRKILHDYSFRWAPSIGAWQRQLTNNARYEWKQAYNALIQHNS